MVDILGDLFSLSILLEKSSEYSLSSHPKNLAWHSCVSGTLSLTNTRVSSLSLSLMDSLNSRLGVHVNVLSNNKTILEEFSDVFSYDKSKVNHQLTININVNYLLNLECQNFVIIYFN